MKTIHAGTPWWAGLKVTCSDCGTVVELEAKDNPLRGERADRFSEFIVCDQVQCPVCPSHIVVERPKDMFRTLDEARKSKGLNPLNP